MNISGFKYLLKLSISLSLGLCSFYVLSDEVNLPQLYGTSNKAWVYEGLDVQLGSGEACSSGEFYVFSKDSVEHQKCVEKQVAAKTYPYTIESDGIDHFITFNNIEYRLIYSQKTNDLGMTQEELLLRIDGTKTQSTVDIILTHLP